jgi:hypothetical protein
MNFLMRRSLSYLHNTGDINLRRCNGPMMIRMSSSAQRACPHNGCAIRHEAEFVAERQSRLERMSKRLREVGLSVPQMTERDLTINMRALASAMLKGEFA